MAMRRRSGVRHIQQRGSQSPVRHSIAALLLRTIAGKGLGFDARAMPARDLEIGISRARSTTISSPRAGQAKPQRRRVVQRGDDRTAASRGLAAQQAARIQRGDSSNAAPEGWNTRRGELREEHGDRQRQHRRTRGLARRGIRVTPDAPDIARPPATTSRPKPPVSLSTSSTIWCACKGGPVGPVKRAALRIASGEASRKPRADAVERMGAPCTAPPTRSCCGRTTWSTPCALPTNTAVLPVRRSATSGDTSAAASNNAAPRPNTASNRFQPSSRQPVRQHQAMGEPDARAPWRAG